VDNALVRFLNPELSPTKKIRRPKNLSNVEDVNLGYSTIMKTLDYHIMQPNREDAA
jgi:hypothetical protein